MKFLLGFAAGLVLALVYAPEPGEQMRARLAEKARKVIRLPERKAEELAETTKEKAGELGGRIGREAAEAAVQAVQDEMLGKKPA